MKSRTALSPVILAGCVDRHDVGVMELGGCLRFATKANNRLGGHTQSAGQHFERDLAIQRPLPGLVDNTHPAAAEFAHDLKITEESSSRLLCHAYHPQFSEALPTSCPGWRQTTQRIVPLSGSSR